MNDTDDDSAKQLIFRANVLLLNLWDTKTTGIGITRMKIWANQFTSSSVSLNRNKRKSFVCVRVGSLTTLFYRIVINFIVFILPVCMIACRSYGNLFLAQWDSFFEFVASFSLFSQWRQCSSRLSQFGIGFWCIWSVYVFSRHRNKCKFLYFVYLGFGSYRFQFSLCCNCCYPYSISVI